MNDKVIKHHTLNLKSHIKDKMRKQSLEQKKIQSKIQN